MLYRTPNSIVRKTAFRKNAVNMWIPFKWTSEGVKYTNKTREMCIRDRTSDEVKAFIESTYDGAVVPLF